MAWKAPPSVLYKLWELRHFHRKQKMEILIPSFQEGNWSQASFQQSVSPLSYSRQQNPPKLGHPSTGPAPVSQTPHLAVLTAGSSRTEPRCVSSTEGPSCLPGCSQQGQFPPAPCTVGLAHGVLAQGNWTRAAALCAGQPGSLSTRESLSHCWHSQQQHRKLQEHTVHGGEGRKLDHPCQQHSKHTTAQESHKPQIPLVFCSSRSQENLSYTKNFAPCRGVSSGKREPLCHLPQRSPLRQTQSWAAAQGLQSHFCILSPPGISHWAVPAQHSRDGNFLKLLDWTQSSSLTF